jgi:gamma-glutamyltranspeptidase
VQLIIHLVEEGMDPQQAVDAPRMRVLFGGEMALEPGHPLGARFPEAVGRPTSQDGYGAAQIVSHRDGRFAGGADPRRDGSVIVL